MSEMIIYSDIVHISKTGLVLKNKESEEIHICFNQCRENYAK